MGQPRSGGRADPAAAKQPAARGVATGGEQAAGHGRGRPARPVRELRRGWAWPAWMGLASSSPTDFLFLFIFLFDLLRRAPNRLRKYFIFCDLRSKAFHLPAPENQICPPE